MFWCPRNQELIPVTAISCLLFVDVSGEHYTDLMIHDPWILMIFNQATNLVKGFTNTNIWWEGAHIYYYLFYFDCLLFEIPSFSMIATMKPFVNNKTEFSTKQTLQEVGLRDTDGQFGSAIINFWFLVFIRCSESFLPYTQSDSHWNWWYFLYLLFLHISIWKVWLWL